MSQPSIVPELSPFDCKVCTSQTRFIPFETQASLSHVAHVSYIHYLQHRLHNLGLLSLSKLSYLHFNYSESILHCLTPCGYRNYIDCAWSRPLSSIFAVWYRSLESLRDFHMLAIVFVVCRSLNPPIAGLNGLVLCSYTDGDPCLDQISKMEAIIKSAKTWDPFLNF